MARGVKQVCPICNKEFFIFGYKSQWLYKYTVRGNVNYCCSHKCLETRRRLKDDIHKGRLG
jgi:hypothetical protein